MKNCREYCRWAQHCDLPGEEGLDPEDCVRAWRLEDCWWDAVNGCERVFEEKDIEEEYDCEGGEDDET